MFNQGVMASLHLKWWLNWLKVICDECHLLLKQNMNQVQYTGTTKKVKWRISTTIFLYIFIFQPVGKMKPCSTDVANEWPEVTSFGASHAWDALTCVTFVWCSTCTLCTCMHLQGNLKFWVTLKLISLTLTEGPVYTLQYFFPSNILLKGTIPKIPFPFLLIKITRQLMNFKRFGHCVLDFITYFI
jgi:hypothetical protein